MSRPVAPYYFRTKRDETYHWELLCPHNRYPDRDWDKASHPPPKRKACETCSGWCDYEIRLR